MVARQEEVQTITLPLTAVSAAGLLLVYAAISSPNSPGSLCSLTFHRSRPS